MTEFELWDIFVSLNSVLHAWVATYFTILTAYIIAAYMVGADLSRFQVLIISIGFVWFVGLCTYAGTSAGMRCAELGREIMALNPSRAITLNEGVMTAASMIMYGGILVALIFMWQVRHPKTE